MLSIYELPDRFFLHASAKTEDGFYIASEPTSSAALETGDIELGELVIDTLRASSLIGIVPTPQMNQYTELDRTVLRLSGCKSWMAIHRKGKLCEILSNGSVITIIPMRNGGTKGEDKGFSPLREKSLTVNKIDAAALGKQLREGFRLCE